MKSSRFLRSFFIIGFICIGSLFFFIPFLLIKGQTYLESQPSVEVAQIYQPAPTPGSDLQALEANAEILIPANAREIHGMISGFQDLETYVRFDLPNTDFPFFIQNSHCIEPLQTVAPIKYSPREIDPDWWQPNKAVELQECSGLNDHLSQHILVDKSKTELFTIYVLSTTQSSSGKITFTPKP